MLSFNKRAALPDKYLVKRTTDGSFYPVALYLSERYPKRTWQFTHVYYGEDESGTKVITIDEDKLSIAFPDYTLLSVEEFKELIKFDQLEIIR